MHNPKIDLDKMECIAIIGDRNSGKSNLGFYLLNQYSGTRNKCVFGYPKHLDGYVNLHNWNDLIKMSNAVIFMDELQKYIKVYDRRANYQLMELVGLFAHNRNTLIFTTQLSQYITRGVEAIIDVWCVKQIDLEMLKNGSKPRIILRRTASPQISEIGVSLNTNEFVMYSEKNDVHVNGVHTFEFQNIGKDWAIDPENQGNRNISENTPEEKTATEITTDSATGSATESPTPSVAAGISKQRIRKGA